MMQPLNLLMIERTTGYSEGGLASHVKELATFLSARGHSVEIMTCTGSGLRKFRGIGIHYLPRVDTPTQNKFAKLASGLVYTTLAFFWVLRLLRKQRYHLVVVFFYWEAFLMRFIYTLTGIRYSYIMAGDTDLELIEGKRACLPIQISNYMAKECREEYGYSPAVIPKGIDLSRFGLRSDPNWVRRRFHLENDKIILTVAMLSDRKDLITLVRAARIVLNESGRETFLIVGDGSGRHLIEEEIRIQGVESKVKLLGSVRYQDALLPALYGVSNLFVLPTLYEGFGWVFIEAMASGLPIISTNVGSNPEVIGDVAILVPSRRPEILAEKILWLLSDRKKLNELRQRGLQEVKKYDWNRLLPEYENAFYHEIARAPKPLSKRFLTFASNLQKDLPALVTFYRKKRWQ